MVHTDPVSTSAGFGAVNDDRLDRAFSEAGVSEADVSANLDDEVAFTKADLNRGATPDAGALVVEPEAAWERAFILGGPPAASGRKGLHRLFRR